MTKQQPTLDGFIPRRAGSRLGDRHTQVGTKRRDDTVGLRTMRQQGGQPSTGLQPSRLGLSRSDVDESLKSIDLEGNSQKDKKGRRKKGASKRTKIGRIIKWSFLLVIVIGLVAGGYMAYKSLSAGSKVFKGNILDAFTQNQPLKQDSNGRSNILILGTSDDDPGHQGADLTDSIMIMSVDQNKKNAYMISIPRDLWVNYGQSCLSGNSGKINVYYSCVGGEGSDVEKDRTALTASAGFIGGITGLDIQYGVNVNYTVMRDLVNAVGGITVTIQSRDPRGVMDSNFDWKCGVGDRKVSRAQVLQRCPPSGHFIDFPNGPVNLDAEHALYLAQARGDIAPTYGLEQSNFDREKNQQLIVKALREKAVSAGVLTDFNKVNAIIDTLGTNLRTTFEAKEVRTLISLAKDIKSSDIQSISLIDGDSPVMTTGDVDGQSVVEPSDGVGSYSSLQGLLNQSLSSNPITREKANVTVLNGSGVVGVAQTEADQLTSAGFIINTIDTAPAGQYSDVEVYQIGTGMTATKAALESKFKIKVKTTTPPATVVDGTNFVVIIGKDPSTK